MNIFTTRSLTFLSALFVLVSIHNTAAASNWRGSELDRSFPAEQINSYPLVIADSGDEADVYYPQATQGRSWQYVDQFPVVVMMQGAMVDKEYYSNLAAGVARHGFVVVVPNQRNSVFNNRLRYAEISTIPEVLNQMRTEDMSPDSPIYEIVDTTKLAVMGHSFGGAATMFAVAEFCTFPFCNAEIGFERPPELQAVVLTASNARSFDFDTTGIPIAIVRGGNEIAVPAQNATYETLEPPRALITVDGATHYGLCDADVPPGARPIDGETEQTVPQSVTANRFSHWAGTFLRAHIHKDPHALRKIYNAEKHDGVTVISQQR